MASTAIPLRLTVENVVGLTAEAGYMVVMLRSHTMSLPPGIYEGVLAMPEIDSFVANSNPTTKLSILTDTGSVVGHFGADDFLREMNLSFTLDETYNGALLVRLDISDDNQLPDTVELVGNLWQVDPTRADCAPSGIES